MVKSPVDAAAVWHAYHHRYAEIVVGSEADLRRLVHDLVHGRVTEVGKLHFGNRPHAVDGSPYRRSRNDRLRQRRIDHTVWAELLKEAVGNSEHASARSHILAQDENALIL